MGRLAILGGAGTQEIDIDITSTATVLTLSPSSATDFVLDNTHITGSTIIQLGTDTNATDFQVQNDTGLAHLKVDSGGSTTIGSIGTVLGNLSVWNGADEIQLVVRGHSTQTSKIIQVQTFAGIVLWSIENDGQTLHELPDNLTAAWLARQGSNDYIRVNTSNTVEAVRFGNTTTNPVFQFLGSGAISFGGTVSLVDSALLNLGDSNDLSLVHNGTDSVITNITGDLIIDNTLVTGSTIMQLGTDTSATDFQVQNNSSAAMWSVFGDGTIQEAGVTQNISHHLKSVLMDDMYGRAATEAENNPQWVLNSGTDDLAIDPAIDEAQAGGVFQCVTGDADGTTAADGSGMVWIGNPIQLDSTGGVTVIEARIRIKSDITLLSLGFGLTDSTALEEPFTGATATVTPVAIVAADDIAVILYPVLSLLVATVAPESVKTMVTPESDTRVLLNHIAVTPVDNVALQSVVAKDPLVPFLNVGCPVKSSFANVSVLPLMYV